MVGQEEVAGVWITTADDAGEVRDQVSVPSMPGGTVWNGWDAKQRRCAAGRTEGQGILCHPRKPNQRDPRSRNCPEPYGTNWERSSARPR